MKTFFLADIISALVAVSVRGMFWVPCAIYCGVPSDLVSHFDVNVNELLRCGAAVPGG